MENPNLNLIPEILDDYEYMIIDALCNCRNGQIFDYIENNVEREYIFSKPLLEIFDVIMALYRKYGFEYYPENILEKLKSKEAIYFYRNICLSFNDNNGIAIGLDGVTTISQKKIDSNIENINDICNNLIDDYEQKQIIYKLGDIKLAVLGLKESYKTYLINKEANNE